MTQATSVSSAVNSASADTAARRMDAMTQFQFWWDSSLQWANDNWLKIAIAIGAAVVIYAISALILTLILRRAEKLPSDYGVIYIVGRVLQKTRSFILLMISIRIMAGYADPPNVLMQLIHTLFTIAIVLQVAIWLREIILGLITMRAADGQNETLANAMGVIRLLISVALFGIAGIVILDNMGVNVTALVAGLGIGGIAIGLAAQGIFSDLFASLSIIFDRPFRVGETIKYDQSVATVERIGLKSTRLRSVNGELLVISNTNLLAKEITNYANLHRRRMTFSVGVIFQTPPEMLRILPQTMAKIVTDAGQEFVRSSLLGFGTSSLDFELVFDVFTEDVDVANAARTEVGIDILEKLASSGYVLAYPTQTTFTASPNGQLIMPYGDSLHMPAPLRGA